MSAAITALVILVVTCSQTGLLSVRRSKPSFQNKPGNQVRQIALAARKSFRQQENCLLDIYVSLQYPSLLLIFPLLRHLEKLDFSLVSTEAGHRPNSDCVMGNFSSSESGRSRSEEHTSELQSLA